MIPFQDIDLRKGSMLGLKRYLNPSVNTNVPFVFHSSYFRTCNNRYAKNISTVHDFTLYSNTKRLGCNPIWNGFFCTTFNKSFLFTYKKCYNKIGRYVVGAIIIMVFLNAFPFSTPLASLFIANMMFVKYKKLDNQSI